MEQLAHTVQHRISDEDGLSIRVRVEFSVDRVEVFVEAPGAKAPLASIVAKDDWLVQYVHNPYTGAVENDEQIVRRLYKAPR